MIPYTNSPEQFGFSYHPDDDCFVCPQGCALPYDKLYCVRSTGNYLRCYLAPVSACSTCSQCHACLGKEKRRRILASSFYPAFFRGHKRAKTPLYDSMMRMRAIWAEGTFAVLKLEHNLKTIRKRGLLRATEESLLSAIALNLKRMVKAISNHLFASMAHSISLRTSWLCIIS